MAEFVGLHVDLEAIYLRNKNRVETPGCEFTRKGGLIINTGDNPTKRQVFLKREANKKAFGLTHELVESLKLPKAQTKEWLKVLALRQILSENNNFSCIEKIHHLNILSEALERKLTKLVYLRERNNAQKVFKRCHLGVVVEKTLGSSLSDTVYQFVEVVKLEEKVKSRYKLINDKNEKMEEFRLQAKESRETGAETDMQTDLLGDTGAAADGFGTEEDQRMVSDDFY